VEIGILGPLQVVDDDGRRIDAGPYRQRAVLTILVLHAGSVVSLDRLIDLLWGETPPNAATGSLQAYVSNLRRVLEPTRGPREAATVLVTEAPGYRLGLDADAIDAVRFERLAAEGREHLLAGRHAAAVTQFDAALALWRGEALAEFRFEAFAAADVARLDELRVTTEEDRVEAHLAACEHTAIAGSLEALVARHPLRERLRAQQMLTLYRMGRQAESLRVYDDMRRVLAEELGVEPGPQLREVFRQVLEQDPALDVCRTSPGVVEAVALPPVPSRASVVTPQDAFVGRARALEVLQEAYADAAAGRTRVVLIGGEPGVGKTRLADEAARRVANDGATIAWGRCQEDVGMPALWPWEQVLRATATTSSAATSIAALLDQPDTPVDSTVPDFARFRLYNLFASTLQERASRAPTVVILDDLQWADPSSLRLLRYLAVELSTASLLIVATFHEPGVRGPGPLQAALADLVRHTKVARVTLDPLTVDDVAELLRGADVSVDDVDAIATDLHHRTDGNAFFVTEVLRLLASEHALDESAGLELSSDIPLVVGDVIRRRLSRLPDDVQAVLTVAAIIGREFDLDLLHRVAGLGADDAFELLEAAVMAGTIVEVKLGEYRFGHGLVHETLYDDLSPGRRTRLHLRVAEVIEVSVPTHAYARVSQLAHHFAMAGATDAASRYAQLAAEQAERSLAHDDAAAYWNAALTYMGEATDEQSHAARSRLLLRLAAAYLGAGDAAKSDDANNRALDAAEASGDVALIAEAALAYGEVALWQARPYGTVDERVIAAIALALEFPVADGLRARLLVAYAIARYYQEDARDEILEYVREATRLARAIDDAELLVQALFELLIMLDPLPDRSEQLAAAEEIESYLGGDLPFSLQVAARMRVARVKLACGETATLEPDVFGSAQRAREMHSVQFELWSTWACAGVEFIRGALDDAERLANAGFTLHNRLGIWGGAETFALHAMLIWREQDRLVELSPMVEPLLMQAQHPGARKLRAYFAFERGAIEEIATLLGPDPMPPDRDFTWLSEMCVTAELCAAGGLGCVDVLYRELLPFAETVATLDGLFICLGSVEHYLGLLAAASGDVRRAVQHLESAINCNDRIAAAPWSVRSRMALADLLIEEPDRASQLRKQALGIADAYELTASRRRLRELLER
jgi:DNA-binding SARP family transcriptional activator